MSFDLPGLLAIITDNVSKKGSEDKPKSGALEAAEDLIEGIKSDDAKLVASALFDLFDCYKSGDYGQIDDDEIPDTDF